MLIALIRTGRLGKFGDIRLGKKAFVAMTAFYIFGDQYRVLGMLGKYLL
jgi:hypothetical protein